jgi:hypothetical protein
MTAPTLVTDAELRWVLAGPDGLPLTDTDPRLPVWHDRGWIGAYGQVWRWNVRIPAQAVPGHDDITDDHAYTRSLDV